jgi:hypothetical protein
MRARIDISEVEAETKIRAKYLRALENEEWDLLPGPTFVKTFLRTYADVLGLDSRLLVEEYKLRHERPSESELRPISPPQAGRRRPQPQGVPRGYVIGLVVVLLLGTLYLLGSGDDEPTTSTPTPVQTTPQDAATPPATATSTTPAATPTKETTPKVVRLQIVPTGPVYVCLDAAGDRRLVNGIILERGDKTKTFRSSRFRLTLGNGDARLRIDGKTRKVPASASLEGIGYEITRGGKRRVLSPQQRPACG